MTGKTNDRSIENIEKPLIFTYCKSCQDIVLMRQAKDYPSDPIRHGGHYHDGKHPCPKKRLMDSLADQNNVSEYDRHVFSKDTFAMYIEDINRGLFTLINDCDKCEARVYIFLNHYHLLPEHNGKVITYDHNDLVRMCMRGIFELISHSVYEDPLLLMAGELERIELFFTTNLPNTAITNNVLVKLYTDANELLDSFLKKVEESD